MKRHHQIYWLLPLTLILSLFLVSCDTEEAQPFEPMESAIFRAAEVQNCRVTADQLEVKSGAGERFTTIATLHKDDVVRVLGKIDNWYVIRLSNYRIGCIDSTKTTPVVREDGEQPATPGPTQPEEPTQPTEPPQPTQPDEGQPDVPPNIEQPDDTAGPTDQENQLVSLINSERRKNGLSPLRVDPELSRVAGIKAQDMVDNNYFSHNSPTYGSPFDMMKEFGIKYQYAGENIAKNTSVNRAHESLMNSAGHRRNILSPNFTNIGVGIREADRGYIYVEMFIGVPK